MLKKIWKLYNVSTIMILPIFDCITDEFTIKGTKIKYPFIQLLFEYGLVNTFLYKNKKRDGKLYLKFDKKLMNIHHNITNRKLYSILELLLISKYYSDLYIDNDYVYIGMKIDEKFEDDIQRIIEGKYSELSDDYISAIDIKQKFVAKSKNELTEFIAKTNLAYKICTKNETLRLLLEEELKTKVPVSNEFYEKLNKEKENWEQT